MFFPITDLLSLAAGDDTLEVRLRRQLDELADDLNSALAGYEVRVTHLDTRDYLEFIERPIEPQEETE
jgi:hypothetical protein